MVIMGTLLKSVLYDTGNLPHKPIPIALLNFKQWPKQVQILHYLVLSKFVNLWPLPHFWITGENTLI